MTYSLRTAVWFLAFALSIASLQIPSVTSAPARYNVHPCSVGKLHVAAECGTFVVPENRSAPSRTIALDLIVLKATHPTHQALIWVTGGPGQTATDEVNWFTDDRASAAQTARLRTRSDFIFVNARGTGKDGLSCNLYPANDPKAYFTEVFPLARVRACRTELARRSDLSRYSSNDVADDYNDLRQVLGYDKLSFWAGSYGTLVAMVYARRHPESFESAALQNIVTADMRSLLSMPRASEIAYEHTAERCSAQSACHSAFPHFRNEFTSLLASFDAGPRKVTIVNQATKQRTTVLLSKEVLAEGIRHEMYQETNANDVPGAVHQATLGDFVPIGNIIQAQTQGYAGIMSYGEFLSVTCAEAIPFITARDVADSSRDTFLGDLRIRAQQRACAIWDVTPVEKDFVTPITIKAPVLMIGSADDAGGGTQYAQAALHYMPKARLIIIPHASHDDTYGQCENDMAVAFLMNESTTGLPMRCVGTH